MMLLWMAYAMLAAATLSALGMCVEFLVGNRRPVRRLVWVTTIVASVVGPVAASMLVRPTAPQASRSREAGIVAPHDLGPPAVFSDRGVIVLWMGTSFLVACWVALTAARLRRRMIGLGRQDLDGTTVLVSRDFGPAVVGIFRSQIVLPQWVIALNEADRRLVLVHEMEHRSSHDSALLLAGIVAVVLVPWNAALWWQISRLRLAIEFDCDARVIGRHGHDPFHYGELLVAARTHAVRSRYAALLLAPARSTLGRRIEALVDREPLWRSATAIMGGALLVSLMALAPAPQLPAIAHRDAAPAPVVRQATYVAADTIAPRATTGRYQYQAGPSRGDPARPEFAGAPTHGVVTPAGLSLVLPLPRITQSAPPESEPLRVVAHPAPPMRRTFTSNGGSADYFAQPVSRQQNAVAPTVIHATPAISRGGGTARATPRDTSTLRIP